MFPDIDPKTMKLERDKAKALRQSRWWQNLIQKTTCYYCQTPLAKTQVTMDHIVPVSRGGRSTKGNVAPCCKTCNSQKKYLTPVEWQAYLDGLNP